MNDSSLKIVRKLFLPFVLILYTATIWFTSNIDNNERPILYKHTVDDILMQYDDAINTNAYSTDKTLKSFLTFLPFTGYQEHQNILYLSELSAKCENNSLDSAEKKLLTDYTNTKSNLQDMSNDSAKFYSQTIGFFLALTFLIVLLVIIKRLVNPEIGNLLKPIVISLFLINLFFFLHRLNEKNKINTEIANCISSKNN